jgi:hypothetical protein
MEEVSLSANFVKEDLPEDQLLPRRRELLVIIREPPDCTFNPKTLHYDLLQLQKMCLIVKAGKTRGCSYRPK